MWIKKINEYYENRSEYDNHNLHLHVARDLIDMLKERITFELDSDDTIILMVLKYGEDENSEIDEEGFLFWCQMTWHKELIDIILSLKQKFLSIQDIVKQLTNDVKTVNESKQADYISKIEKNNKELEALSIIMNKVDSYRKNTFAFLRDKDSIERMISYIKIYRERID